MPLATKVRDLLGLPADTPEAAVETALSEALTRQTSPANAGQTTDPAPAPAPDPAHYAPLAALMDLQAANKALQAKVDALEQGHSVNACERAIDAALADGRLSKASEEWARTLARTNPAILDGFLRAAAPVAALTGLQSGTVSVPEAQTVALSEDERYACRVLGMTEDDFCAEKKERK